MKWLVGLFCKEQEETEILMHTYVQSLHQDGCCIKYILFVSRGSVTGLKHIFCLMELACN